jgi:hypothetical protein
MSFCFTSCRVKAEDAREARPLGCQIRIHLGSVLDHLNYKQQKITINHDSPQPHEFTVLKSLGASLSDAIFDQGAQDLWQQYEAIAGHKPMAPATPTTLEFLCALWWP